MRRYPAPVALALFLASSCFAIYVDGATGDNSNDGQTWDTAKKTIQAAVDVSTFDYGQDIYVAEGTYHENVDIWPLQGVFIRGGYEHGSDQSDPEHHPTVVDGSRAGPVFTVEDGVQADLYWLVIQHGRSSVGAGLRCMPSAIVGVGGCTFQDNLPSITAPPGGGYGTAIASLGASVWASGCTFRRNYNPTETGSSDLYSAVGGGISADQCCFPDSDICGRVDGGIVEFRDCELRFSEYGLLGLLGFAASYDSIYHCDKGVGVNTNGNSAAYLSGCTFLTDSATGTGVVLECLDQSNAIDNCTFTNCNLFLNPDDNSAVSSILVNDCAITGGSIVAGGGTTFTSVNTDHVDEFRLAGEAVLRDCAIRNGLREGILCTGSSAQILRSAITGAKGVGAACASSNATVEDCLFACNDGAVYVGPSSNVAIVNCTLAGNLGPGDGALYVDQTAHATLYNSIIAMNSGHPGAINLAPGATIDIRDCDFFANCDDPYWGLADPVGSNGNIGDEPLFASAGASDFHLLNGSRCLGAADPTLRTLQGATSDIEGNSRVCGSALDMGCYEAARVSGLVELALFFGSTAGLPVDVHVTKAGQLLEEFQIVLDSTSHYACTTRFGTFDIVVKPSHWVSVRQNNAHIGCGVKLNWAASYNGDGDGSNKIGIGDLSVVLSNWGTNDPMADLDGSGAVGLADISIILLNFGTVGE